MKKRKSKVKSKKKRINERENTGLNERTVSRSNSGTWYVCGGVGGQLHKWGRGISGVKIAYASGPLRGVT